MHLARLVGAVLAPHHRVHRELGVGRSTSEDRADARVLVVLEPELRERLLDVRVGGGGLDGLVRRRDGHTETRDFSTETNMPRPSVPGPVSGSTACSGWGMRPTTLPAALQIPAMSRRLPLGLEPRYRTTTRPSDSSWSSTRSSATYCPSPFLSGMTISAPTSYSDVHAV